MNTEIDIIVPWVDGSDPEWQKVKKVSRERYCPEETSDSNIRFESWDNLKYWFRAVERFMPWVHKIFFVTWGHLPDFLDTEHSKLKIVKHEDYIPEVYLPTFNSNTIEMNYHRIEELSENFILFNDDMIPLQPIDKEYYFLDDQVCDEAVENIIAASEFGPISNMARYTQVNNMIIINKYFDKRKVQEENYDKWYYKGYGPLLERTESLQYWYDFPGFYDPHMPSAMKKSVLRQLWELEPERLHKASLNHFRGHTDVTQYLIRYWQLCRGDFHPRKTQGKMCLVNRDNYKDYAEGICRQEWQMVSLNEDCSAEEFGSIKSGINKALDTILPDACSFEKRIY